MTWHENCNDFDSRIEASALDNNFNDTVFLLTQPDADNEAGDKVSANKAILALISPVFYAQFYGPLATTSAAPIEIVDGTAQGFKQLINFICNPVSFKLQVENVDEMLDISYFAHKYQIGSLVSSCRQFLVDYNLDDIELETLIWATSSERGLEMKETFPAEHALLVYNCFEHIGFNFKYVFPGGKLKEGKESPDEACMMEILQNAPKQIHEEMVLSVAIDFYCKMIEKSQKIVKGQKRMKMNDDKVWDDKLEKIKSVVQFERCHPGLLDEVYEKFFNKIPAQVLCKITKEISSCWKEKKEFSAARNKDKPDATFSLVDKDNTDDWIHEDKLNSGAQIKFKTNQNAIMYIDTTEIDCPCREFDESNKLCCMTESIIFHNEDYNEEVIIPNDFSYFYVKGNKEVTLSYQRKCKGKECELHLVRVEEFHFSKGNFEIAISEVNGELVTSPCYTFINTLHFVPL